MIDFNTLMPRQSNATFGGTSVLSHTVGSTILVENAVLNGCVDLQGRPSPPHPRLRVPLRVSLTVAGDSEPIYQFELTTFETGCFTIDDITPDTYEIRVKKSTTLQNMQLEALQAGHNSLHLAELREGDANDDNFVTILDFSILAAAFGTCEGDLYFDPRADFNGDGCITILDFSLLATNFGQGGEGALPAQAHSPSAPARSSSERHTVATVDTRAADIHRTSRYVDAMGAAALRNEN